MGTIFVQVALETIDGQHYGVLGGYCSEECEAFGHTFDHPVPVFDETPLLPATQPRLF